MVSLPLPIESDFEESAQQRRNDRPTHLNGTKVGLASNRIRGIIGTLKQQPRALRAARTAGPPL
jgi:hypothetical protein